MKHIAILSTMYYPDMGAPSAVIDKYVQKLQDEYCFTIITKTYNEDGSFENKDNIRYITGARHRILIKCNSNIRKGKYVMISKMVILAIDIYKFFLTQFSNPTANSWENKAYYEQLTKLHNEHPIDCVISVSNTCFCQFAANEFKRINPSVKWITFITDPFAENYIYYRYKLFKKWWKKRNASTERKFYMNADYNFFSIEMYKFALNGLKVPKVNMECLHYALDNRYKDLDSCLSDSHSIRLIYAGAVYRNIRNPEFMLEVISNIPEVKLDMYINAGECEDILEQYTRNNITRQGYAPKDRYDQMICCDYDVLVNIGNISTLQTPSKTVDLLSTGKPIINFYFSKDSQFEMIEKYPLGLNIRDGEDGVVEKVRDFCIRMKGRRLSFDEVESIYPDNNLERQTEFLRKIIEA